MRRIKMDYKQKYEEALERAKVINPGTADYEVAVKIFPELKKSEDDIMINFISHELACLRATDEKGSDRYEELTNAIAWLEKQGGKKPIESVEPKFKVGDWITDYKSTFQIVKIEDECYVADDGDKIWFSVIKQYYHRWTIQDVKDGDVLAVEPIYGYTSPFIAICKECELTLFASYCFIDFEGNFNKGTTGHSINCVHPATKEQCDLLFQKMKEAGYEWDAEKKELKKIEQKPTWSEEDERIFDSIIEEIIPCGECPDYPTDEEREYFYDCNRKIELLKSIKQRMKGK